MSDSQKLSRIRWAIRDILQFLQSDRRVPRSRVEKAARYLNDAGFGDSAALLEAEFQPVFRGRKCTPELLSFVQSLFDSVDDSVSQRMKHEVCAEGFGKITTPDQPPTPKPGEGNGGNTSIADPDAKSLEHCKPSVRKAYYSFKLAEAMMSRRLEDKEAWDLLHENDWSEHFTTELTDYQFPSSYGTWARQLRDARKATNEQKYTPRTHK